MERSFYPVCQSTFVLFFVFLDQSGSRSRMNSGREHTGWSASE